MVHKPVAHHYLVVRLVGMLIIKLLEHTVCVLGILALLVDVHLEKRGLVALAVYLLHAFYCGQHMGIILLGTV